MSEMTASTNVEAGGTATDTGVGSVGEAGENGPSSAVDQPVAANDNAPRAANDNFAANGDASVETGDASSEASAESKLEPGEIGPAAEGIKDSPAEDGDNGTPAKMPPVPPDINIPLEPEAPGSPTYPTPTPRVLPKPDSNPSKERVPW